MKRKSTETNAYTINKFSQLVGFDRQAIASRLEEIKAKPVAESAQGAGLYHLRDLTRALLGGDIEAERLRLVRAQADKLESQLAQRHRDLVRVSSVTKLGQGVVLAIKNHILASPLPTETQDKILRELVALGEQDWSHCE